MLHTQVVMSMFRAPPPRQVIINNLNCEKEKVYQIQKLNSSGKFTSLLGGTSKLNVKSNINSSSLSGGGGSISGNSNYWKRSKFSWFCLIIIVIGLIWLYNWYSEHQRKLRYLSYLERADELNVMIKQMQGHLSSAQVKLTEIRQLQNLK